MANWKKGYDPNQITDLIESVKQVKNGKISFKGFTYSQYVVVLPSMVNLDSSIPEIENNRIIRKATSEAGKKGKITAKTLISHINKVEQEFLKKPLQKFKLVTGISISKSCKLPHTRIEGSTIVLNPNIINSITVEREVVVNKAEKLFGTPLPNNYSQISVSVNARTEAEAADLALNRLDFIRGLWNLSKNRRNQFRMSFGNRNPVNSIVLYPIHTLHKPNGGFTADSYWWEPQYQGEIKRFSRQEDLETMHSYMQRFRTKLNKCNYKDKIMSAVVRYVRALDSSHWENSFLHLWGILETLTNTTGDNYKVTVRRASYLYRKRKFSREILSHLRDFRNRSVHAGEESGEIEAFLFQLKNYVEKLITFLVFNSFNFKSIEDASEFLDLPDDHSIINEKIRKLEFAKSFIS